jgi:hypothetical protein
MHRLLGVGFGLLALVAGRPPAAADGCLSPGFQLISPSGPAGEVPRNTRVRVAYAGGWQTGVTVVLRAGGREIPTAEHRFTAGARHLIELIPDRPLAPSRRYEVVARERVGPRTVTTVVGQFATGELTDRSPPRWPARGVGPAADDVATPSGLLYAVWLPDPTGRVDPAGPPAALVPMAAGHLAVGADGSCGALVPPLRGRVVVRVAAVDEAGNRSPVRRLRLHP